MLMIGEQFGEFNDIVNGMVAQTRGVEDVRLQVWTTTTNEASNRFIARKIIQALQAAQVHARMEFHVSFVSEFNLTEVTDPTDSVHRTFRKHKNISSPKAK